MVETRAAQAGRAIQIYLFIYLFMYTATSVEVIAGVDYTTKNMSRENNKREHIQQQMIRQKHQTSKEVNFREFYNKVVVLEHTRRTVNTIPQLNSARKKGIFETVYARTKGYNI